MSQWMLLSHKTNTAYWNNLLASDTEQAKRNDCLSSSLVVAPPGCSSIAALEGDVHLGFKWVREVVAGSRGVSSSLQLTVQNIPMK